MNERVLRLGVLTLGIVLCICAVTVARPKSTPGPALRDFEAYYAAGATANAGGNPYSIDIWHAEKTVPGINASRNEVLPFVGPPHLLLFLRVIASQPYEVAAALWSALNIIVLGLTLIMLLQRFGMLSVTNLLATAMLCVGFGPLTSSLALGQAATLSFCGIVWLSFRVRRIAEPFAILTSAIQPNMALASAALLTRRRIVSFAVTIFLALAIWIESHVGIGEYLGTLAHHGAAERFALIQISLPSIVHGFGASDRIAAITETLQILTAAICFGILVFGRADAGSRLARTICLLPFFAPFFHEHNFIVLLFVALWIMRCSPGVARYDIIAGTALGLIAVDWLGLAQRPDSTLQSLLLLLTAACAMYIYGNNARLAIGTACIAPIVVLAGIVATQHVAPIWPDAMQGVPPLGRDVAQIWHEELARTGQFMPNAVWATLRLMPLLGCALLFSWLCLGDSRKSLRPRGASS